MKLSVYLVEDDVEFGKRLLQLLLSSPLLEVLGHALTMAEARTFVREQGADVFLLDINLPDGNSIDLMREIRQQQPQAKMLVLSTLGHEKHIVASLQAGAAGYLLKSERPEQILHSILNVANDGAALGPHACKVLIERLQQNAQVAPEATRASAAVTVTPEELAMLQATPISPSRSESPVLTGREQDIIRVVQHGSTTKQVAQLYGISAFTVNQHLRSIYRKLGVRNKMEAVQAARRCGIL